MTLIIKNASDEFANAIKCLAKIDNAIVQLQDDTDSYAYPLEQSEIYKDFQNRMATNPSQHTKLLQEVRDEIFTPHHQ